MSSLHYILVLLFVAEKCWLLAWTHASFGFFNAAFGYTVRWPHSMQCASLKLIFLVVHFCCRVFLGLSDMQLPKRWLQAVHCTLYFYHLYSGTFWPVKWLWLNQLERPGQSSETHCRQQCFRDGESCKIPGNCALKVNVSFIITIYICISNAFTKADMWKNTRRIADFHMTFLDQPWVICYTLIVLLCILY